MARGDAEDVHFPSFVNVRVVLQYLMDARTATLELASGPKAELPGFCRVTAGGYHDADGDAVELTVIYRFGGACHIATVSDVMPLTLPNEAHRQWIDCERRRAH